jgi:dephospho-CoA kinase
MVVDGIRHAEIIPVLRQIVTPLDFRLVFVGVNESIREARLVERGLSDRQQWQQLEAHSTEAQVQTVLLTMADLTVDGTRKIQDLVLEIVGWIKQ